MQEEWEVLSVRLVDADALKDEFWSLPGHIRQTEMNLIICAPTADAVPVVHGRWEAHPTANGYERCSVCRDCIIYGDWADGKKWGYCPHCGAKMDGGE